LRKSIEPRELHWSDHDAKILRDKIRNCVWVFLRGQNPEDVTNDFHYPMHASTFPQNPRRLHRSTHKPTTTVLKYHVRYRASCQPWTASAIVKRRTPRMPSARDGTYLLLAISLTSSLNLGRISSTHPYIMMQAESLVFGRGQLGST
jgi:hypothetical protein